MWKMNGNRARVQAGKLVKGPLSSSRRLWWFGLGEAVKIVCLKMCQTLHSGFKNIKTNNILKRCVCFFFFMVKKTGSQRGRTVAYIHVVGKWQTPSQSSFKDCALKCCTMTSRKQLLQIIFMGGVMVVKARVSGYGSI